MKRNVWAIVAIWLAVVFIVCGVLGAGIGLSGMKTGVGVIRNWDWDWNWRGFSSSYTDSETYNVDFESPLPQSGALNIGMVSVDVRVVADDTIGNNMKAHFEGRRSGGDANRIEMQSGFNEITLKQESPMVNVGWNWGGSNGLSGVLTVYMPSSCAARLSAVTVSGNVNIDGLRALDRLGGDSVSGGVYVSNVQAEDVSLHSVSGRIEAPGLDARSLSATTVSGDINIVNASTADVTLGSTSGGIAYGAPTLDNASVSVHSVSGGIHVGSARARGYYSVSGSSGSIKASTVSGDIDIL